MAIGTPTSLGAALGADAATTVQLTGVTAGVGDLVIVVAANDGGAMPSSVSDSAGNTYTADNAGVGSANNYYGRVFSSVLTTALSNGSITASFSGISGTWDKLIAAAKVTGSWDSTRADKTASATGTGTAWDSGLTATTTVAAELVFGFSVTGSLNGGASSTSTPGTGLTELHDPALSVWDAITTVYKIVSATGTYKANGTWSQSFPWGAIVVTYKEVSGGSALTQTINDSVTMSDALAMGVGLSLSEAVALADAIAFGYGLRIDDSVTTADAIAAGVGLGLADSVTMADALSFSPGLGLADSVTMSDSQSFGIGLGISDVVSLAESLVFGEGLSLSEALAVTDSLSILLNGQPVGAAKSSVARTIFISRFGIY